MARSLLLYAPLPPTITSTTASPTMARTSKSIAAPHNSTRGEASIQDFANSNLPSEQLRQRAVSLLNSKELLQNVLGLTPEDQTKFVDKVDQVRRDHLCSLLVSSLYYSCEGISDRRPTKCEIRSHLRGLVQYNRAASNFGRTLCGTRETWQHSGGIWRTDRRLARATQ